MKTIIIIVLIGLAIWLLFLIIHHIISCFKLKGEFNRCNVIVFGPKGSGKDLIFQKVINLNKKKFYYSNIDYGYKFNECRVSDLNLGSNTYENFINNSIKVIDKYKLPYEKCDFYLSDCGIILPSQYDSQLHKSFKGFPISYALSRHLWSNNIHANTQNLERVWKALREQADSYILCKGVKKIPFVGLLKVDFIMYDRYQSALNKLTPVTNRIWNSYSKAERDLYNATNGRVEKRFVFIHKRHIKYDTRAYHEIIFGEKFIKKGA